MTASADAENLGGVAEQRTPRRFGILFLCTGNSARSILAEALARTRAGDVFTAHSAGSEPTGIVNRFALETLEAAGIVTDGLESKDMDQFLAPDAPPIDIVVTVCDRANDRCPVFPGGTIRLHWGLPDPARIELGEAMARAAFRETFDILAERIERLAAHARASGGDPATMRRRLAEEEDAIFHPL